MKIGGAALMAIVALVLGACAGSDEEPAAAKPSAAASTTASEPATETMVVSAGVVALDALGIADGSPGSRCESLGGQHDAIRTGATIELLDSSDEVVSTAELERDPRAPAQDGVCAWEADFYGVPLGRELYRASIAGFESDPLGGLDLRTQRLVIDTTR
ncbi:hypothetical protein [Aeromicrobium sp. IC_218]|uniref:hypothetical protein n=1 Tax=Aeromicrobium sp. IC_218 TaxID=2545468 RepID=UPI00103D9B52|nr:hypothetical protein [Aeromicrobium sp. IC_218]TCI96404.1 hypothetical protein E0W78_14825 [Aeromicrobium sp. IC_218]